MKKICRFALIGILTLALVAAFPGQIAAAEDSRQSLEECLEEVKQQIDSTNKSLDEIYGKMSVTSEKMAANAVLIATLEESLVKQKADMASRIKYMYEAGSSMDILASILSAESIADALNRAAYVGEIVGYDREKLKEYADTLMQIEVSQAELEDEQAELAALRKSFEEAKLDYGEKMTLLTAKIVALDIEEAEAARLIEEYMAEQAALEQEKAKAAEVPAEPESPEIPTETEAAEQPTEPEPAEPEPTEPEPTEPEPAEPEPTEPEPIVPIATYGFTEEEIYDLARITYLEAGCSYPWTSYRTVYLVACVVLNRAINWYDGSLSAAIYAPGQYSTAYRYTNWGGGELYINDATWEAVNDALTNLDPNPYFQCNGDLFSDSGLEIYYRDPDSDECFYYDY